MVERGVILAPNGTRIEVDQMFSSYNDQTLEFGIDGNGGINIDRPEPKNDIFDAVLNGDMTLDQCEARLIQAAVDKAKGNLSSAARMLGLTRPQLAYRLGRLHESASPNHNSALSFVQTI